MRPSKSPPAPFDLVSPAFKANPYPTYAWLRAEAPVYRAKLRLWGSAWLVTRYDDVVALLKDERFMKNRRRAMSKAQLRRTELPFQAFFRALEQNMLDLDNPDHARLRNLVHKAFTPKLVEGMRERVQRVADSLIDAVAADGQMDLVARFARPLPMTIISEMLGIPSADRPRFTRWSRALLDLTSNPGFANVLRVVPSLFKMTSYLRALFRERRRNPEGDLVTELVRAEEAGDRLSEDELLAMVFLLLIAGHETTVNLIASGTLALLEHPDELARLRSDPTLVETAVEELLRYTSPVEQATERYAAADLDLDGVAIQKGELVLAVLASANRDEKVFPNPDALDLARDPNRHLAFGHGIHFCLGAPLARLEGQVAIPTLLRRLPNLRLAVPSERLRWRSTVVVRGLERLPVAF